MTAGPEAKKPNKLEVWIVEASIPREGGKTKVERSAPTTYTRAKREVVRLLRLGIKATITE